MIPANTILRDRYRVVQHLSKGGMGAVYQAIDENLNCVVAVKEAFALSKDHLRAFKREAQLLANLNHPALPKVTDHFVEGDGEFLVMQFIPGHDFAELMAIRERPFAVNQVLEWADTLLDALQELHTHKPAIIHRDIKPSNLKLTPKGKIILLDFGLAKGSAGQMSTLTDGQSGYSLRGYTRQYAPPEQIRNAGTDHRSDLYSLGATLWSLLTAKLPPDASVRATEKEERKQDPLRDADEVNPDVPHGIASVLRRAMSLNRSHRPSSAARMKELLREANQQNQEAQPEVKSRTRRKTAHTGEPKKTPSLAKHLESAEPADTGQQLQPENKRRRRDFDTIAGRRLAPPDRAPDSAEPRGNNSPPPTVGTAESLSAAASANSFEVRTMQTPPHVLYSKDELAVFKVEPSRPLPPSFAKEHLPQPSLNHKVDEAISRGNAGRDLKDYARAEEEYRRALLLDPTAARIYYALGSLFYDQGRFQDAIQAYKEGLRNQPNDAIAYKNLGIAYEAQQRYSEAIEQYQKAIKLDPAYAHAYNSLGQAYARQLRYADAIEQFRKAIEMDPKYARAYNGLGSVYYAQKQHSEAIEQFRRAIELDPRYLHAYANLGNAYYALQRYPEAIEKYQKAIELNPKDAHAYANLGNVFFTQKRYEEAIRLYERAIELDSKKSYVAYLLNNLGRAYYAQQLYSKAIEQYKKAVELDPQQGMAHYSLGLAYLITKDRSAAAEQYETLRKLNSNYANKLLREINKLGG
jgi:tetratricopeptide (TPR) repeat protein/predicted Ser/Thr protein kinase